MAITEQEVKKHIPEWLQRNVLLNEKTRKIHALIQEFNLNTVCQSARCPNKDECFSRGTATFMILGNVCTRGCRFCSVPKGKPQFLPDENEPEYIARAVEIMKLKHVVVTSVNRDDLPDQGSLHFVQTIRAIRKKNPGIVIEVLTPDFQGNKNCIKNVTDAGPDIYNHNLETVPRLYQKARPGAIYKRSLELIQYVKKTDSKIITKSGIMLGLGETLEEVTQILKDLHEYDCDCLTLGQYMQPAKNNLPVFRYLMPEEFTELGKIALQIGFKKVFSGPLIRSSYHAEEQHRQYKKKDREYES